LNPTSSPSAASEAIAAGDPAVSVSFRFHRPRGPLCGRGYCFQCEVPTPQGRQLACQAAPKAGTRSPRRDPLRPLGAIAERFPPWFYESRVLRPKWLRGLSLHALRYLSAAPPLSPTTREMARRHALAYSEVKTDLAVVGSADCPPGAFRVDLAEGTLAVGLYPDRTLGVLSEHGFTAVRFERVALGTGSYERLPPIAGNDLPGVVGIRALETYGAAGGLRAGTRIAVWAPQHQRRQAESCAERHGLSIVWMDERAPEAILGPGRVRGIVAGRDIGCELFVIGVSQPAIELALQGGATAELSSEGLPILAVTRMPDWMRIVGGAAERTSRVPDVPVVDRAFACLCEDVRVGDLKACVEQGFSHPELIKRRTGAMTGPCQGKLCSAAVLAILRELGCDSSPIRARPLARPVSLRELAADA
jgi:sarcosine oxidase alpha subunit family protein